MFEWLPEHQINLKALQKGYASGYLPQALLLTGPSQCRLDQFASNFIALILCSSKKPPCGHCTSCLMMKQEQHPEVQWIQSEKKGGMIKIDQIRQLQSTIFQTPHSAAHKFIVIQSAESLNVAAANALLKILEEPPSHTIFILIAGQISTIPATIISRCQLWRFYPKVSSIPGNILDPALYTACASYDSIFKQQDVIITGFLSLVRGQMHPSVLAEQWKTMNLQDLLWLLYLLHAQMIIIKTQKPAFTVSEGLMELSKALQLLTLFKQLDKIQLLQKRLVHNLNVNTILALETILTLGE